MSVLGVKFSTLPRPYTVLTQANYAPSYPATELAYLDAPFTLARTLDTSDGVVVLDLGAAAPSIAAFSFEQQNFGMLNIAKSATGVGDWTSFGDYDMTGTRGYGGRRIRICEPGAVTFDQRYVQLTPSSPDAGATVYEWGVAAAWPTLTTMTAIVGLPYSRRVDSRTEVMALGGGGTQYGVAGSRFVQILTSGEAFDDEPDQRAEYQALANQPDGRVILWNEALYGDTAVYHMRRTAAVTFAIEDATMETVSGIQLSEVVN